MNDDDVMETATLLIGQKWQWSHLKQNEYYDGYTLKRMKNSNG